MSTQLALNQSLKMSHFEIAEIAGKRADNVKSVIDRLATEGAIQLPKIQGVQKREGTRLVTRDGYMLNRIDSITVMATVDGLFCARLVQRWDELEQSNNPIAIINTMNSKQMMVLTMEMQAKEVAQEEARHMQKSLNHEKRHRELLELGLPNLANDLRKYMVNSDSSFAATAMDSPTDIGFKMGVSRTKVIGALQACELMDESHMVPDVVSVAGLGRNDKSGTSRWSELLFEYKPFMDIINKRAISSSLNE